MLLLRVVVTVTRVALVLHLKRAAVCSRVARRDVLISLVPAMKVCTQSCVRSLVHILILRYASLANRTACSDLLIRIVLLARIEGR